MIICTSALLAPHPSRRGDRAGQCSLVNCSYTGNDLWLRDDVLQSLTSNVTAAFTLTSDLICPHCCEAWNAPAKPPAKAFNRAFLATPERALFPVIAADSATPERPRRLVHGNRAGRQTRLSEWQAVCRHGAKSEAIGRAGGVYKIF